MKKNSNVTTTTIEAYDAAKEGTTDKVVTTNIAEPVTPVTQYKSPTASRTVTSSIFTINESGALVSLDGKEQKFEHKSDMFRFLYDSGMSVGEISKFTGSHYSFVYGVISSSREITKKEGISKSDVIRDLAAKGMTAGQIAKELNSNYSFVHSVVKKYRSEQAAKAN